MPNNLTNRFDKPVTWGFCLSLALHGLALVFILLLHTHAPNEMITVDFTRAIPTSAPTVATPKKLSHSLPTAAPQAVVKEDSAPSDKSIPTPAAAPATAGSASSSTQSPGANTYLGELRSKIESLKQYPAMARNRGQTGKAEVAFTVLKSGEITNIRLVSKTPFEVLNNAALAAVSGVRQFKPIPDELARSEWEIQIPIVFKID
jgi:protein TonB